MSEADTKPQNERLRDFAKRLAERLGSPDGERTLAHAAEATRRRSVQIADATRLDPSVLHKRVTF